MTLCCSRRRRARQVSQNRTARLEVEVLEDRTLPSAGYLQTNLVGYQAGMARVTDANLNGWGIANAPDGPFCVANNSTGTATFYSAAGHVLPLVISIPTAPGQPFGPVGSPTGVVYNSTSDFVISAHGRSAPASFIFDTFDGLICGWNPYVDATHAIIMVDNSKEAIPAFYTGLELARNSRGQNVLYAVDDGLNNRIDMYNGKLHSLGSFTDPSIHPDVEGTAFQAENINGKLYVTFTQLAAPFGGTVDVFDTDGDLLRHFAANAPNQGPLNAPWAIVLAPGDFGKFSNDLLIGNVEGAGNINAFDPRTGAFLGALTQPNGTPIAIPGLWDMTFGGGGAANGKPDALYFTAGFTVEDPAGNGLFGVISATGGDGGHGPGPGSDTEPCGTPATSLLGAPGTPTPPGNPAANSPLASANFAGLLLSPNLFAGITQARLLAEQHRPIPSQAADQVFADFDDSVFWDTLL